MNYNFDTDIPIFNCQFEPAQQYPDPLAFIGENIAPANRPRNSLDAVARHEEIPSSFDEHHQENLELKKIFSSTSHENMLHIENDNLFEAEKKFELSEDHHAVDDAAELGSYLREYVTNASSGGEGKSSRSNSDEFSPVDVVNSNEESSDTVTMTEDMDKMFDGSEEPS